MARFQTLNSGCADCQKFRKEDAARCASSRLAYGSTLITVLMLIVWAILKGEVPTQKWLDVFFFGGVTIFCITAAWWMVKSTEFREGRNDAFLYVVGDNLLNPDIHIHLTRPKISDKSRHDVHGHGRGTVRIGYHYLKFRVGSEKWATINGGVEGIWHVRIDPQLRLIKFNTSDGSMTWHASGFVRLDVMIETLVESFHGMVSLVRNYQNRKEAERRLYVGASATLRFMEETGALKRSPVLAETYKLLNRGIWAPSIEPEDWMVWNNDVPDALAESRQKLGLTYGPKQKTA